MTDQNTTPETTTENVQTEVKKGFGCLQVSLILIVGMIFAAVLPFFALQYFTQTQFNTITQQCKDEQVLGDKLPRFDALPIRRQPTTALDV